MNLKLFTPAEKKTYFIKANYNELLNTDTTAKTAYYSAARQWGWMSQNEIRHEEGRNGIGESGDIYLSPANMVTGNQLLLQNEQPAPEPTQQPAPSVQAPLAPRADQAVIDAIRGIVVDGLKRLSRREIAAVRRAATKPGFAKWCKDFYPDHEQVMVEQLTPSCRAYEALSGLPLSIDSLASKWCDESRKAICGTAEVCLDEQIPDAVEQLLGTWNQRIEDAI